MSARNRYSPLRAALEAADRTQVWLADELEPLLGRRPDDSQVSIWVNEVNTPQPSTRAAIVRVLRQTGVATSAEVLWPHKYGMDQAA